MKGCIERGAWCVACVSVLRDQCSIWPPLGWRNHDTLPTPSEVMRNIDARGLRHPPPRVRYFIAVRISSTFFSTYNRAAFLGSEKFWTSGSTRRHTETSPIPPSALSRPISTTINIDPRICVLGVARIMWSFWLGSESGGRVGSSLPSVGYYFAISLIPIFRLIIIPRSVRWIMCTDLSTNQFAFRSGTKRAVGVSTHQRDW